MSARMGWAGAGLMMVGAALVVTGTALGGAARGGPAMMGFGMMGQTAGAAMMGGFPGSSMMGGAGATSPGPGQPGFVAGTVASPRVIRVLAGPGYTFVPAAITVARGETVTFEVTTMGPLVHEFIVGPADAVAADRDGTPEVADIGMMQTKTLTFTFDGQEPYAFACHEPGHYEAGMRGTINVVG